MSDKIDNELNDIVRQGSKLAAEIDWEAERRQDIADADRAVRSIEFWLEIDKQQERRNEFRSQNILGNA